MHMLVLLVRPIIIDKPQSYNSMIVYSSYYSMTIFVCMYMSHLMITVGNRTNMPIKVLLLELIGMSDNIT